ncbi:MAG: nucleoside deaminase [Chryseolinea sp.]
MEHFSNDESPTMKDDTSCLNRCLELAKIAASQGENPVGSIVVRDGIILGEGLEMSRQLKDITRHAEVVAILDAISKQGDCRGATLYSNVEPCILCAYVIRHYRIARVVFTNRSGELGGFNSNFSLLTTSEIKAWGEAPTVLIKE